MNLKSVLQYTQTEIKKKNSYSHLTCTSIKFQFLSGAKSQLHRGLWEILTQAETGVTRCWSMSRRMKIFSNNWVQRMKTDTMLYVLKTDRLDFFFVISTFFYVLLYRQCFFDEWSTGEIFSYLFFWCFNSISNLQLPSVAILLHWKTKTKKKCLASIYVRIILSVTTHSDCKIVLFWGQFTQ